jgi:hypothetical protein
MEEAMTPIQTPFRAVILGGQRRREELALSDRPPAKTGGAPTALAVAQAGARRR